MGRGIVICSFHNDIICQLENIEKISASEWVTYYSNRQGQDTNKVEYEKYFTSVKKAIGQGRFEKVVLTKCKKVATDRVPMNIFHQLNRDYLNTFNYILSCPNLGSWMGASPEMLCEIEDDEVTAISLAGTKSAEEDWTNKEIEEQLYVTRFIQSKLRDLHCSSIEVDGPHNIQAGPVMHLKSIIKGKLISREAWRKVIEDLHPTPATCGMPAKTSQEFISSVEQHDRSIYTGFIGLFGEDKKQCFVNLRCMEFFEDQAVLFTGGGITKDSELEREWQETERKAGTLEKYL